MLLAFHGMLFAQAASAAGVRQFWAAVIVVGTVAAVSLLAALVLLTRRRYGREIGEIVEALEELRTGNTRRRAEVESGSPLGLVADAVHRLGHDLHHRMTEADRSAERWRALTDASRETAIITTDTDGDVRSFSAGAAELFGWEEDEVISRPAAVLFEESSYRDLLPKLARRSLRRQGITTRAALARRDGSMFQAEVLVRMLSSAADDPVGFMIVIRDISEQLRSENELRESERRYRGLVDGLSEGVVIVRDGRIVYANPAAEQLSGKEARELLGSPFRDRISTRDVLMMEERLAALQQSPDAEEELACTLIREAGAGSTAVRIKARGADYAGGPAVILLLQDETLERRVAAETGRHALRLDAVLEATSDGILLLAADDSEARVQVCNQAFAGMLGRTAEELLGFTETRLLEMLRSSRVDGGSIADLIEAGSATLRQQVAIGEDDRREYQVTLAPLLGRNGELLGRVIACRDLSEQRDAQRQLQEQAEKLQLSKVELEQSYRKLSEANATLAERADEQDRLNHELGRLDEMKSKLLGNVSHELQTPLVSIRGYTEMILKERLGPVTEEQRKGLGLSLTNIDRLISMIDNLVAFTRKDHGLDSLKLTRFSLKSLIDEAVDLMREKIQARELMLTTSVETGGAEIEGDRDKILQVVINLLSNAIKFNRQGGRIQISAERGSPGYARVTVRDSGVGIPQEALGRVFDRHFRVRQGDAAENREGSGIGLSIVRDVLRLHGCTIHVESESGRGASFVFTLPLGQEAARREHEAPFPQMPVEPESSRLSPEPEDPAEPAPRRPKLRIIRPGETKS